MHSQSTPEEVEEYRDHVWRSGERLLFDFDDFDLKPTESSCSLETPLEEAQKAVTPPRSPTLSRSPTPPTPPTRPASTSEGSSTCDESFSISDADVPGEVVEHSGSLPLWEVPFESFHEHWVTFKKGEETFEAEDSVFDLRVDLDGLGHINIRELPLADGVHASTGCQLWPASVALGRVLLSRPWLIHRKSVIELGAGCGFAGVAAARLAHKVLITDCDAETVANLHHNVARNWKFWHEVGATKQISTATLDWRDLLKHGWPANRRMDVVIGSDIIYGNWGPMVAGVAEKVLNPDGQLVMVSAEDRGGLPEFRRAMEASGFSVDVSHWVDNGKRFLLYICGRATQQCSGASS
mmetsp:Transcript_65614/g.116474  ORF Transcript_65614/g.116474 Transcript_65614/m.116474 type:complete len:352 (-) Transcript_65614:191-1246(-)